jgi:hypothetical protein
MTGMTTWREFSDEVPEFAAAVRAALTANIHLIMGTIRADGSPRLCGTEIRYSDDELLLGGMTGNWRFKDLRRDPRLAIHSGSQGGPSWKADAKLSGTAVEILDPAGKGLIEDVPPGPFELFAVRLTEVTHVHLEGDPPDKLVIETWRPGQAIDRKVR